MLRRRRARGVDRLDHQRHLVCRARHPYGRPGAYLTHALGRLRDTVLAASVQLGLASIFNHSDRNGNGVIDDPDRRLRPDLLHQERGRHVGQGGERAGDAHRGDDHGRHEHRRAQAVDR